MPPRTPKQYHTMLGDADENSIKDSDSDGMIVCSVNKLAAFAEMVRIEAANEMFDMCKRSLAVQIPGITMERK